MPIPPRTEPWVALFETLFIGPLVENCIEVVKRDQTEALAWAAEQMAAALGRDVRQLPGFKSVENSDTPQTKFPWAIIEPGNSEMSEHENGESMDEGHKVEIEFAITGRDPSLLTVDLETYALAMHQMLISARPQDLFAGYGPLAGVTWEVSDHEYSRSSKTDSGYLRAARMTLTVKFSEVKQ